MALTIHDPGAPAHPELPEKVRPAMAKALLRNAEPNRQLIGKAIERAYKLRGWSLKEFAGHCARDERQIARWITGVERPQFDVLFALPEFRSCLLIAFSEIAGEGVVVTTHIEVRRIA